jgi:hypothetical protein
MGLARVGYEPEGNAKRRRLGFFAVICGTLMALAVGGFGLVGAGAQTNTGTIKIFDATKDLPANEPKPNCPFLVVGENFDPNEEVTVDIEGQGGPNSGPGEFHGVFTTDSSGFFQSSPITLPSGMYKANSEDGEGGGDKNKVFKVECPPEVPPTTAGPPTTAAAPPGPAAAPPGAAAAPAAPAARPPAPAAPRPPAAVAAQPRGVTG